MGTSNSTLLVLGGIDFSPYASRGISSTLGLESTGALRRDINGTLHDCTLPQFYKRTLDISCTDIYVPNFVGIRRGTAVAVTLIPGLGLDGSTENEDSVFERIPGVDQVTLQMMVDVFQVEQPDEWEQLKKWSMSLREI